MSSALTYVYCLVRSPRRPSLRGVPPPMPEGENVRLLDVMLQSGRSAARHWLVVSTVPQREYGEAALDRGLKNLEWVGRHALAHEAVVEHFLPAAAVLPMQLFTLFTSDERAAAHVTTDGKRIAGILSRIQGQLEWGVRVTWDERAARDRVERQHGAGRRTKATASGASYLARKRDLLNVSRGELGAARAEADRLFKAITRKASDSYRRTSTEQAAPGSRLLLDAAFLVPASRSRTFRAEVARSAKQLETTGLAVSLTGPWPAYNFI